MLLRDEQGGATAEFAIVLPTMLIVIAFVLGGLGFAALRIGVVSAAYDIARLEARGDTALALERSRTLPPRASVSRARSGGLLCVTVTATPIGGVLKHLTATSTGCAAVSETL